MRTYNTSVHSGIGATPLERYQQARSAIRMPKSREWLEECFLNRITRKVNKDSTVSIDKVSYDVPMQFISSKVEIRFLPDDMSSAFMRGSITPSGLRIRMGTAGRNATTRHPSIIQGSGVRADVPFLLWAFLQSL